MRLFLWILMAVLSMATAIYSWRFVFFTEFFEAEQWQHHLFKYPVATYAHFGLGPLALFMGSFQFLEKLRLVFPAVHRAIGWIYVVSCVWAGFGALPLAFNSMAGPFAATGFTLLALSWLYTTTKAFLSAKQGGFYAHRVWMIRSFALTFAGVTLRLYIGIFHAALEWDFDVVYTFAAWFCWLGNIIVVELYLAQRVHGGDSDTRCYGSSFR